MASNGIRLEVQKTVVYAGELRIGVAVRGPNWIRFAVARIPLEDLPIRDILVTSSSRPEHEPQDDPWQDTLPGIG